MVQDSGYGIDERLVSKGSCPDYVVWSTDVGSESDLAKKVQCVSYEMFEKNDTKYENV